MKKTKLKILTFSVLYFIFSYSTSLAAFVKSKSLEEMKEGDYSLDELVCTFTIIAKYGLGIVAAIVLLFFIYGGFVYLTSGGSQERISSGKNIVINSALGLLVVLSSALIVQFAMTALGHDNPDWTNCAISK